MAPTARPAAFGSLQLRLRVVTNHRSLHNSPAMPPALKLDTNVKDEPKGKSPQTLTSQFVKSQDPVPGSFKTAGTTPSRKSSTSSASTPYLSSRSASVATALAVLPSRMARHPLMSTRTYQNRTSKRRCDRECGRTLVNWTPMRTTQTLKSARSTRTGPSLSG